MNNLRLNLRFSLFLCGIIFFLLQYLSEQKANLFLAICAIMFVPALLFARIILMDFLERTSIKRAKRRFISGQNTLCNDNCMVKYTPNEKIVVTDNINCKHDQYAFTVTRYDVKNINKCWNDICRLFDEYTYLKMLANYFDSFYSENSVRLNLVKKYMPQDESDTITQIPQEPVISTPKAKININAASAQEISELPGLNLIMAKKAIDFRNKHNGFSDEEEFFNATGVKDFFKSKIKPMIKIEKSIQQLQVKNKDDSGRIVDF